MIESNQIRSMILSGPPGTGKTTIAEIIATSTDLPFRKLNAVAARKADIDKVLKEAGDSEKSILLYIDEIHRLTRTQIEPLLGVVEDGSIILVGSTTESPYHAVPPAILSRCTVFEAENLATEDVVVGLKRSLDHEENGLSGYEIKVSEDTLEFIFEENGLSGYEIKVSEDTLEFIANSTGGDLRASLNVLENAVITNAVDGKVTVTNEMIEGLTGKMFVNSDGDTSEYNLLSAFHKSVRGSDVDASLYYLAQLLQIGALEQVVRRIRIIAMEDVAFTNLNLSSHVHSLTAIALETGMPEARIPLSAITIECCLTPKSNSAYEAIDRSMADVRSGKVYPVPPHLRDGHFKGAPKETRNYELPHQPRFNEPVVGGWSSQSYLPKELEGRRYFQPDDLGHQKSLKRMYEYINSLKDQN